MNIGGIVKNSFVDYPKKISCVIFVNGCNLKCWYCHNYHLIENKLNSNIDEEEVLDFLKSHKSFLDAVVISGGEPTLQHDLIDFIKKVKLLGYKIKLDTNGTNFKILKKIIEEKLIDYIAMDIKAPFEKYEAITKVKSNIENIKKSIAIIKEGFVDYEFRTTLSPDLTLKDIESISLYLLGAKNYSLQQYRIPKKENTLFPKPLAKEFILKAQEIAKKYIKNVDIKGI